LEGVVLWGAGMLRAPVGLGAVEPALAGEACERGARTRAERLRVEARRRMRVEGRVAHVDRPALEQLEEVLAARGLVQRGVLLPLAQRVDLRQGCIQCTQTPCYRQRTLSHQQHVRCGQFTSPWILENMSAFSRVVIPWRPLMTDWRSIIRFRSSHPLDRELYRTPAAGERATSSSSHSALAPKSRPEGRLSRNAAASPSSQRDLALLRSPA